MQIAALPKKDRGETRNNRNESLCAKVQTGRSLTTKYSGQNRLDLGEWISSLAVKINKYLLSPTFQAELHPRLLWPVQVERRMWGRGGYRCFLSDALCISLFSSASAQSLHCKLTQLCPEVHSLEPATWGTGNPRPPPQRPPLQLFCYPSLDTHTQHSPLTLSASRTCSNMISTEIQSQKLKLLYNYNSQT